MIPGTTNFSVVEKGGKVVESKTLQVIGHQYAEEIRLIPRFDYLKRNERNRIDFVVVPSDAEDTNELIWHNSNPEVLQIDEKGNVIAMAQGKARITVSGKETENSIEIEVKPDLQGLSFPQEAIRLKCGESVVLECQVIPEGAPMENLTWEIDNKTIASLNPAKDGRRCQVIAATGYEGKGNIRCYDPHSRLGAICNIEVIFKIRQSTLGKAALACLLFGIIMPLILPVSIGCGIAGLITDKESERHMRYIISIAGSVIAGIIWIILAMGA